jgi:hypothetical protein
MKTKKKLWKIIVVYDFLYYKLSVNLARYSIHPDTTWVAVFTALCRKFATKAKFQLYTPMNGHFLQFCVDEKASSVAFMFFLENCIFYSTWKYPEIVQFIHSSL